MLDRGEATGEVIGEHGNVKIYKVDNEHELLLKIDGVLWALGSEIIDYKRNIGNMAKGDCLEIGLGLGVASGYILSFPEVKSLTTVDLNADVIKAQKQANFIDDDRHTIINMDGLSYINGTEKTFDFIFFDHYRTINKKTVPGIAEMVQASYRILNPNGRVSGWASRWSRFKRAFRSDINKRLRYGKEKK